MFTKPSPLLPQLLAKIPAEILSQFRMEGDSGGPPAGGGAPPPPAGGGNAPTTFAQADVDRIVQDRIARERAKFSDYDDLKTKAAKLADLENQSKSDQEKAVEKARKEADDAARKDEGGKWSQRIVRAEVKALAGGKLADPADAVAMLDLSEFKLDDTGNVDPKAVEAAIDKLLEAKPYLAAGGTVRRPAPQGSGPDLRQGARGGGAAGGQTGNDWLRNFANSKQ